MKTEPLGTEVIERYLRTRRRRYFRGQHDGEYFVILTVDRERLHVHLEIPRKQSNAVTIRVTPAFFFPEAHRERLLQFTDRWNRDNPRAKAILQESSDPTRIGVIAENSYPVANGIDFEDFAGFVDQTIHSAIQLFGELTPVVEPPSTGTRKTWVLDAG